MLQQRAMRRLMNELTPQPETVNRFFHFNSQVSKKIAAI
jgi:hypothetical protein